MSHITLSIVDRARSIRSCTAARLVSRRSATSATPLTTPRRPVAPSEMAWTVVVTPLRNRATLASISATRWSSAASSSVGPVGRSTNGRARSSCASVSSAASIRARTATQPSRIWLNRSAIVGGALGEGRRGPRRYRRWRTPPRGARRYRPRAPGACPLVAATIVVPRPTAWSTESNTPSTCSASQPRPRRMPMARTQAQPQADPAEDLGGRSSAAAGRSVVRHLRPLAWCDLLTSSRVPRRDRGRA